MTNGANPHKKDTAVQKPKKPATKDAASKEHGSQQANDDDLGRQVGK